MKKRTWTTAETFSGDIEIAHFGPAPIRDAVAAWSVKYADGRKIASGEIPSLTVPLGNGIRLRNIKVPLANVASPAKLIVTVSLKETLFTNHWDIWVYPANLDTEAPKGLLIAGRLDEKILNELEAGRKVLLMPPLDSIDSDIPAGFTSIFWNTAWTSRQPPHTLGILCNPKHPALAEFPTEFHSNWQWWDLVTKSRFMVLDKFAQGLRPIVQVIDDWNTNRKLGLLFEARIGRGKLLVCSIDLKNDLDSRPVARQMLYSLLRYMESDNFNPKEAPNVKLIENLIKQETNE